MMFYSNKKSGSQTHSSSFTELCIPECARGNIYQGNMENMQLLTLGARVTVLGLCVCVSGTPGYKAAKQRPQCYVDMVLNVAFSPKPLRSKVMV